MSRIVSTWATWVLGNGDVVAAARIFSFFLFDDRAGQRSMTAVFGGARGNPVHQRIIPRRGLVLVEDPRIGGGTCLHRDDDS